MRLSTNEKGVAMQGDLILTDKRLVQEKKSLGSIEYKEIPLAKLDSIYYTSSINIWTIITGILLAILGFFLNATIFYRVEIIGFMIIIIGIVGFILGIILRKNFVEFKSASSKIRAENRNLESFIEAVRSQIYKN